MFKIRKRQLELLSQAEIEKMRAAGQIAATLLKKLGAAAEPGMTTLDLDDIAVKFAKENDVVSAPYLYQGGGPYPFPKSICTSLNQVVCHGIPNEKDVLKEGDIISIDVTLIKDGFHGDTCGTFFVGEVSEEKRKLTEITAASLIAGLKVVKAGKRIGAIGAAIQKTAEPAGYSVVREFQGHGIGRKFHTAPDVPHFGRQTDGAKMRAGMAFTIEPMINIGDWPTKIMEDGWTAETADGSLCAQFEHTIVVTEDGMEVMTVVGGDDPLMVSPGGSIRFS